MANNTIFQNLTKVLMGEKPKEPKVVKSYNLTPSEDIIFKTNNKEEYENRVKLLKQQRFLNYQWRKATYDTAQETLAGLTNVKLMFRDADLMDDWPEIGAALDIYAEECCTINKKGKILNIYSQSKRIKEALEDLFVNRLDIHVTLPMIIRCVAKYGNEYQLLRFDQDRGIIGWKQLPVYEIERIESGMLNPYVAASGNENPDETKFIWVGRNESIPYLNWQVAHFRLITDSIFLPYGCSILNKARRHWRMLSMMEDMMLIYRLERSIERRIFKIYVGAIDEDDVQAFVNDVANTVKRTPIIDPMTGQLDLRKNFLDMSTDYFIPVRDQGAPTPIETLPAAQSLTSMDDINYMQNKVLSALKMPKVFLNFDQPQGQGQNFSLLDIRFAKAINRIQQAILMELNKIAIIHLYLRGFRDDLTNFTLSLNNPSSQIEMLEIDNLAKKIETAQSAISINDNLPIYSYYRALKEIMGMDESEINKNLEEIRLERALFAELNKTDQIIKRTGVFDPVDRIYGEDGAEYSSDEGEGESEGLMHGGSSVGGGFSDMLGGLNEPGGEFEGEISGNEGSTPMSNASSVDNGENIMDSIIRKEKDKLINEKRILTNDIKNKRLKYKSIRKNRIDEAFDKYINLVSNRSNEIFLSEKVNILDDDFLINEELNNVVDELDKKINDNADKSELDTE